MYKNGKSYRINTTLPLNIADRMLAYLINSGKTDAVVMLEVLDAALPYLEDYPKTFLDAISDPNDHIPPIKIKRNSKGGETPKPSFNPKLVKCSPRGKVKIPDDDIRTIRRLAREGNLSQREIGEMFQLCPTTISKIVNRRVRRHVKDEPNSQ